MVWLWQGNNLLGILDSSKARERGLAKAETELRAMNPEAAAFLDRVKDERDRTALAASLRVAEMKYGEDSALRVFAESLGKNNDPAYYRLLRLAADAGITPSQTDREAILYSHGTTVQFLLEDETGRSANVYLDQLETAAKDRGICAIVRDDPVALLMWPHLEKNEMLWQFYQDEREWLGDVLATATPVEGDSDAGMFLAGLVSVAQRHHPAAKKAVVESGFGVVALPLFDAFGDVISKAEKLGVPVDEALEVVFANQDQFVDETDASALADRLIHLKKNKPTVWEAARNEPLVLRLDAMVPGISESLIKKYAGNDVAGFLFSSYEDEIIPAATALERFGDLGFYILNRYQDDPRTHALLSDSKIGPRAVPFLARFGDEGFEKLDDDMAWLDRYYDAEGHVKKDHSWVEAFPIVGAPINVVGHWAKGNPVSWGELGWAAVDVADGVLLVASFGASAPASAAKQAAKSSGRALAKTTVRQSGQKAAASGAKSATRSVARESLLKAFVRRGGIWTANIAGGAKAVLKVGRVTVGKVGGSLRNAATKLTSTWASSPARFRKWAYRGLLGTGLFFTLNERTIPGLPGAFERIGEYAGAFVQSAAKAAGNLLAAGLREALGINSPAMARIVYISFAIVLALLAAWLFFNKSDRLKRIA